MLLNMQEEKTDPRVRRTRQLLEHAFMEAIQEKGFHAISIQDITEKAGVNRATFYAHFADKYALLDYSIRQMFRQEIEKRMLNACHFTMENLRQLIITVCEFVEGANAHCSPADPQFESLAETQVKEQVRELLQNWIEQTDSWSDPQNASTAASWAIYGLALNWSREKKRPSAEEFANHVLPLIASSLQVQQPA
jgi:AcrR family transcriptional regulator